MKNILLSIKWDPEWQEFSVPYYEDGKYKEGPTYYTDDLQDAKATLAYTVAAHRREGGNVSVRENKHTRGWEEFLPKASEEVNYRVLVKAIRDSEIAGSGSGTDIDEAWTDKELAQALVQAKISSSEKAVEWAEKHVELYEQAD